MTTRLLSTTGQQTAAKAAAKPLPAPPSAGFSTFVAMEPFVLNFRGQEIGYLPWTRYSVDQATKAVILATDRDVVFES